MQRTNLASCVQNVQILSIKINSVHSNQLFSGKEYVSRYMFHDASRCFTNKIVYLQIVPHASGFECKSVSKPPHRVSDLSRKEFRAAGTAPKALAKKRFVTWNRGDSLASTGVHRVNPLTQCPWRNVATCSWHTKHTAGRSMSMKVWVMTSYDSNRWDQLADNHRH